MRRLFYYFCCMGFLFGFYSCQKSTDENESIILLGHEEAYVKPIMEVIPDTLRTTFPNHFGNIPTGYIPPNIEGEYVFKKQYFYSNLIPLHDDSEMHIRITNQHNRTATVELHDYSIVKTDTAYITGSGSSFTLYLIEDRVMEFYGFHYTNERSIIISGEKVDGGIKDMRLGIIITEAKESDTPYISGFTPGMYFIYKDQDGMSDNCNWFDQQVGDDENE